MTLLTGHEGLSLTALTSSRRKSPKGNAGTFAEPPSIFSDEPTTEERLYRAMIDKAVAEQADRIISNGKPAHAVYLIYSFFRHAKRSVRVYCRRLSQNLGGYKAYADPTVLNAMVSFLRKTNTKLSIMVVDDVDYDSEGRHPLFLRLAQEGLARRVDVMKAPPQPSLSFDFLLMDEVASRIEVDPDDTRGLVNFGDEELGNMLSTVFKLMSEDAERVSITGPLQQAVV